ncbi:alpha/beta hydrolase [bacterium]|nr:alpha/beta hydrolase [bacterium]
MTVANRLWLVLLLGVASSASARSSSCLTDAWTLEDQRALAALRAATETACPCATFSRRGAYQRCARAAIDDAIAAGSLRADCRDTARDIAKGATCGSTRSTCGRVRRADDRATCTLSRAAACTDTGRFARTACAAQTHCADVVDWTAGTCLDPRRSGPYVPGYRVIEYTKDSAASPGTPRVLNTSIWYPAPSGSGPIVAATGGVADAPLAASGGPYPLVLFSHGSCGTPLQSRFLTPLLASWGFVVVAPPHPGNTIYDFPNCNTPAALGAALVERPQDVVFVLDQVLAAAADPLSPLFGAIDPTRIAMTGHSFGGLTTYLVTAIEPRIDVAVAMAPASFYNSVLPVPSLTMLGTIDSVISNPGARAAYDRSASPKLLVEIEHTGHYAFSDVCLSTSDCNPPATLTSAEAHADVLRWVLPFLQTHLAGDQRWSPLLGPPSQPGFVYASQ